ncbi:MAG: TonB-dependent receptor [Bacteroidota bacterium]
MNKLLLLSFWGIFLLTNQALAQGTVRGQILDADNGEPLIGATVFKADRTAGANTDADGRFSFGVKQNPPFDIVVTYINYDSTRMTVTSFNDKIKIELRPKSLGVVEIVGRSISEKEQEEPLTVESMGSIAIKEVAGSDFYASLGNLKGVDLTSASLGFKVINTRGFNSTSPIRSLQIIDGVDNQAPGLNFSLGNFLGASELDLQKVDLVQGASSAFYGPNAFNGVISMTTKSPFIHQGLSVMGKVGERNLASAAVRYAHAFKNGNGKDVFAFKLNAFFLRADDWEARNFDATPQSEVDAGNFGGYDAVNRYGDENVTAGANNARSLSGQIISPGLGIYHRDGYDEEDVVDYNTENLKLSGAMHFKVFDSSEVILSSNFGTGTTVYQGDNRYSLRDILFFQHRAEIQKPGKYFLRTYYTHEDAGNSYDAVFTAFQLQDAVKDDAQWSRDYRNYWQVNIVPKVQSLPGFPVFAPPDPYNFELADQVIAANSDSMTVWHQEARDAANAENGVTGDRARLEPGTAAFDSVFNDIVSKTAFTEGGTRFFDRSALYHVHGEYKFDVSFLDDLTVGGNFRQYLPNSQGTIFSDTNGVVIRNREVGSYIGAEKRFWDDLLKVNATVRVDKNQNFPVLVSPALSTVWRVDENHVFRGSFNAAIRNPTLQEQFLYYNVGRAILIGNVNGIDSLVTTESLIDFFNTQNFDTVQYFNVAPIRPERVRSIEVGYRGTIGERLYVDASYYFSLYRDFIGFKIGSEITYDSLINRATVDQIYRVAANSDESVTTQGFSIGLNYYFAKYYAVTGNYSWNRLNLAEGDSIDPIIPAFNTPEHKFNLGFGGRNIPITAFGKKTRNWGFNFNFKWVEGFEFVGSPQFTGFVPTYYLLDGQVNKRVDKLNTTFKIGASNIMNRQQLQVYGGPFIGRMAYFQVLVELDDL